jgi:hypothetical protein
MEFYGLACWMPPACPGELHVRRYTRKAAPFHSSPLSQAAAKTPGKGLGAICEEITVGFRPL